MKTTRWMKNRTLLRRPELDSGSHSCSLFGLFCRFTPRNDTRAFTLAEVLITLGVIGVVAAMTIPTLAKNYQKSQTIAQVKEAYSLTSQAIKQSIAYNGDIQDWDFGTTGDQASIKASFNLYIAPYLKITRECNSSSACGYNAFTRIDGTTYPAYSNTQQTSVILSNGALFVLRHANATDRVIFFDINGASGENKYGKDVFIFTLIDTNAVMPVGYDKDSTTITNSCNTGGAGTYCTAKLIKDGWQIKDDYPW